MKNLFLFVIAVILITFCSDTSPLYQFSASPDPSIFFVCGRMLGLNFIPYVDFADTKGILLMLIYYAASLVDGESFLGVYIIQCVTLYITLFFLQKTAEIYLSSKDSIIATLLVCVFLFSPFHYQRGGGIEELLWPFMAALVYCLAKYFSCKSYRARNVLFFCMGLFISSALMMKYSIAAPICVLCFILLIIQWREEGVKSLYISGLYVFLGLAFVLVPCIAFLLSIGAFHGFLHEYFLSAFRYGVSDNPFIWYKNIFRPLPIRCVADILMLLSIIWGVKSYGIKSFFSNKALMCVVLVCFIYKLEMVVMYNYYYDSILSPCMIACSVFFVRKVELKLDMRKTICYSFLIIFTLILGSLWNWFGAVRKGCFVWSDTASYFLREELAEHYGKKVLHLCILDRGRGIPYGWIPCGRYWYLQNNPSAEMVSEQFEYVRRGIPDIVQTASPEHDDFLRANGYCLFFKQGDELFYKK